jgi:hypothetical protein
MPPTNWELILAQLKTLGENTNKNFEEVKGMMSSFDERVRGIEKGEAGCQAMVAGRLDAAEKKLNEHTSDLEKLEKLIADQVLLVTKLIESQKQLKVIMNWALGIGTTVLIAVLIMFATGQATVVFK